MSKRLSERLRETYEYLPSGDMVTPIAGKPSYSTIDGTGVSTAYYDAIAEQVDFPNKMPPGLLAQVVIDAPSGVHAATAWATLEEGQEYFRNWIGPATVSVIAQSDERGDIVRNEFRLTGLQIGAGADQFVPAAQPAVPETLAVTFDVRIEFDDERGQTRKAAFEQISRIVAAPEAMQARQQGMVLDMGGVTNDGLSVLHVWTDGRAARVYYDETMPRLIAEIMSDWHVEVDAPRCELVHACVVSNEILGL